MYYITYFTRANGTKMEIMGVVGGEKGFREMGESGRESAMFLPAPAKNLLKALAMEDGSVKELLFSLISLIFLVSLFILIASFSSCHVFLGFFFDRDRLVSKYIFLLARRVELYRLRKVL